MSDRPDTKIKTTKDGFTTETRYNYVHKNGHSAWNGFVWKPSYKITAPSGAVYMPKRIKGIMEHIRAVEPLMVEIKGKGLTMEELKAKFAAIGYHHIQHDHEYLWAVWYAAKCLTEKKA